MLTGIFAKSDCRHINQNHFAEYIFIRIFRIAKDIKYLVHGERNGEVA